VTKIKPGNLVRLSQLKNSTSGRFGVLIVIHVIDTDSVSYIDALCLLPNQLIEKVVFCRGYFEVVS
jgi:hypothetical protein